MNASNPAPRAPRSAPRAATARSEKAGAAAQRRILAAAEKLFAEHGVDAALRAPMIIDQRMAGLALADMETDPDRKLELIIKALVVPNLHMRAAEKSPAYARILAREVSDPKSNERGVMAEFFDPVAQRIIEALRTVLPDRTLEELHWGYQVMLGSMVYIMADIGRIERLSGGLCRPEDEKATSEHVVALLHAALKYARTPPRPKAG